MYSLLEKVDFHCYVSLREGITPKKMKVVGFYGGSYVSGRWLQSLRLHPDVRGPKDCHDPKIQHKLSEMTYWVVVSRFFSFSFIFGEDEAILDS